MEVGSMLEVEEALARILEGIEPLPEKLIPANSALGRMTSRDVVAGHHIPPSPISAMDGFAIRAEDTVEAERNTVRLGVVGEIPCGHFPEQEVIPGTAMRIMTVAPFRPVRTLCSASSGVGKRRDSWCQRALFLRDKMCGRPERMCRQVRWWSPREPSSNATGEELVEVDEPLSPGKVRNVNSYSNATQVVRYGGIPVLLGIARDREEAIVQKLQEGLKSGVDLILVSGGVSMGDFDVVKKVLTAEGRIEFRQARMKPGKPFGLRIPEVCRP